MTTGFLTIASMVRMAISGTLMMGIVRMEPVQPVLSTVNVPPLISLDLELADAGARGEVVHGPVEAVDAQLVGARDDRHHQAVLDGDRDADVDVAPDPVALVRVVAVDVRVAGAAPPRPPWSRRPRTTGSCPRARA